MPDDVGVGDVGQGVALLVEAPDIITERLPLLLLAAPVLPGVTRTLVHALKVSHKHLLEVRPALDREGGTQAMLTPRRPRTMAGCG